MAPKPVDKKVLQEVASRRLSNANPPPRKRPRVSFSQGKAVDPMWDNVEEAMARLHKFVNEEELQATFSLGPYWVTKNLALTIVNVRIWLILDFFPIIYIS